MKVESPAVTAVAAAAADVRTEILTKTVFRAPCILSVSITSKTPKNNIGNSRSPITPPSLYIRTVPVSSPIVFTM